MNATNALLFLISLSVCGLADALAIAQSPPFDVFPEASPPYYRVRYEASKEPGQLIFAVNYTIWIPPDVETLRGLVVHQHGCGEGSCKSGLTGAFDLHWQALARKHECALLAPAYEQPDGADCQMWCDPRNGSADRFQQGLRELGSISGHPELSDLPWVLWGHSGGGHWCGGMVMLYPRRVAAAWLRSGVPLLSDDPQRSNIKPHQLPSDATEVPMMCNLGTKEGVTVTTDRFAGVWPTNETFFRAIREKDGLIGVAIDPLTSHECGNQRYLAIPWLDACMSQRLPTDSKQSVTLRSMPREGNWYAEPLQATALPEEAYEGDLLQAAWLPNAEVARQWMQYTKDANVEDSSPPPAPLNVRLRGDELSWECDADLESGISGFIITADGRPVIKYPEDPKNPYGRPIFQNLQYSDTPTQPLMQMRHRIPPDIINGESEYRVISINSVGLHSQPSPTAKKN